MWDCGAFVPSGPFGNFRNFFSFELFRNFCFGAGRFFSARKKGLFEGIPDGEIDPYPLVYGNHLGIMPSVPPDDGCFFAPVPGIWRIGASGGIPALSWNAGSWGTFPAPKKE